jgi:hypothetical protein
MEKEKIKIDDAIMAGAIVLVCILAVGVMLRYFLLCFQIVLVLLFAYLIGYALIKSGLWKKIEDTFK